MRNRFKRFSYKEDYVDPGDPTVGYFGSWVLCKYVDAQGKEKKLWILYVKGEEKIVPLTEKNAEDLKNEKKQNDFEKALQKAFDKPSKATVTRDTKNISSTQQVENKDLRIDEEKIPLSVSKKNSSNLSEISPKKQKTKVQVSQNKVQVKPSNLETPRRAIEQIKASNLKKIKMRTKSNNENTSGRSPEVLVQANSVEPEPIEFGLTNQIDGNVDPRNIITSSRRRKSAATPPVSLGLKSGNESGQRNSIKRKARLKPTGQRDGVDALLNAVSEESNKRKRVLNAVSFEPIVPVPKKRMVPAKKRRPESGKKLYEKVSQVKPIKLKTRLSERPEQSVLLKSKGKEKVPKIVIKLKEEQPVSEWKVEITPGENPKISEKFFVLWFFLSTVFPKETEARISHREKLIEHRSLDELQKIKKFCEDEITNYFQERVGKEYFQTSVKSKFRYNLQKHLIALIKKHLKDAGNNLFGYRVTGTSLELLAANDLKAQVSTFVPATPAATRRNHYPSSEPVKKGSRRKKSSRIALNKLKASTPSDADFDVRFRDTVASRTLQTAIYSWQGSEFKSANGKINYIGFKRYDAGGEEMETFQIWDFVVVFKETKLKNLGDHANYTSENIMSRLGFFIGQIEELFQDKNGIKKAKVAWLYWPSDVLLTSGRVAFGLNELFSSYETDVQPLHRLLMKVPVVSKPDYIQHINTLPQGKGIACIKDILSEGIEVLDVFSKPAEETTFEKKLKIVKRTLAGRTFFIDRHYNARLAKVVAENAYTYSYKSLKYVDGELTGPGVAVLSSKEARRNKKGMQSIDLDVPGIIDEAHETRTICAFCFRKLNDTPHAKCLVCTGCYQCLECLQMEREGQVLLSSKVKMIHRSGHSYTIISPKLDLKSANAVQLLQKVLRDVCIPKNNLKYTLLTVYRGPQPKTLNRPLSLRFRYGLSLIMGESSRAKPGTEFYHVCTIQGKSPDEAKNYLALEVLDRFFGVSNVFSEQLFGSEFSAYEAIKLLDSALQSNYGLAWNLCAEKVVTKTNIELKNFFNNSFLPAYLSQSESGQNYSTEFEDPDLWAAFRNKYENSKFFPQPDLDIIRTCINDSILWAKNVLGFFDRRVNLLKSNTRGLSFAVVDKATVFQPRPQSFGPFQTAKTVSLFLKHAKIRSFFNNPNTTKISPKMLSSNKFFSSKLSVTEEELAEEEKQITNKVKSNQGQKICLNCKKNDKVEAMIMCDGCDGNYHYFCADPSLTKLPKSQIFCQQCVEDRSYLYDHTSFGSSGKVLADFADRYIFSSPSIAQKFIAKRKISSLIKNNEEELSSSNLTLALTKPKRAKVPLVTSQWVDNEAVLKNAYEMALVAGWGRSVNKNFVKDKKTSKPTTMSLRSADGPTRSRYKMKTRNKGRVSFDDIFVSAEYASQSLDAVLEPEILSRVNWATRHFAADQVLNLQYANRGLSLALLEVTEQRNILLSQIELERREKEQLKKQLNALTAKEQFNNLPKLLKAATPKKRKISANDLTLPDIPYKKDSVAKK
eukprot:augustus_masked-scaffold_2-processed-gene-1.10-mRNA-1 protein AED:0.49 eAED:0.49 QI:0/-1/0/1/-1/1/1/0/1514